MSCCSTQRLFAARGRPYRCCWSVKGQSRRQARIGYIAWWSVRPVSCAVSHWPSWRASLRWDPKTKQVGGPDERRSGSHDSSIAVRQTVQCHVCVPLWISDVTANSCLLPFKLDAGLPPHVTLKTKQERPISWMQSNQGTHTEHGLFPWNSLTLQKGKRRETRF